LASLGREDPDRALTLASEARKLCRAILDKQGEVNLLHTMAHASLMLCSSSDEALKALEGKKNVAMSRDQAGVLRRASRDALAHAKSAVALAKWMDDKVQLGIASTYLAQAHIVSGRFKEALRAATEAEALFQELGDELEQAHALVIMAEVSAMEKKNDEAVDLANRSLELARAVGDTQVEDRALKVIDGILGKPKLAAQPQEQFYIEAAPQAYESVAQAPAKQGLDPAYVKEIVGKTVAASLATDEEVHEDSPLMETGMDSLTSVSFRNGLNQQLGMNLPAALMFDYPSQRAIVDHVIEMSRS